MSNMGMKDNTMMTRFGFADLDRKLPEHDIACQYIGQQDVLQKMAAQLIETVKQKTIDASRLVCSVGYERPVSKGEGKYKTTIGFIDVVAHIWHYGYAKRIDHRVSGIEDRRQINDRRKNRHEYDFSFDSRYNNIGTMEWRDKRRKAINETHKELIDQETIRLENEYRLKTPHNIEVDAGISRFVIRIYASCLIWLVFQY